jgi:N-acetylneuraminic acid mutarotase
VLSGDENPGNDTLNTTTTVSLWSSWEPYNPPGAIDDRLTHATIYDNDNDRIYMIGGTPDGSTGSNVPYCYAYDPASDTWNTGLTSMPTSRGWLQGAYWDQRLYVMCGYSNSSSALTNTEIYDIGSDTWSTGTVCPEARLAHGTVAYDGNIYVVGGVNAGLSAGLTTVYRYDVAGDSWTLTTNPLPYEFDMGGVTIWDNVIYIVNGYQRSSSAYWTHVYEGVINPSDPDDITWNQLDPLPVSNIIINGATAMMGNVYQLGGFNINDFWEYEPGTGTWTQLSDYPIPSTCRNHMVITRRGNGEIYAVAGDATSDWGTPNN